VKTQSEHRRRYEKHDCIENGVRVFLVCYVNGEKLRPLMIGKTDNMRSLKYGDREGS